MAVYFPTDSALFRIDLGVNQEEPVHWGVDRTEEAKRHADDAYAWADRERREVRPGELEYAGDNLFKLIDEECAKGNPKLVVTPERSTARCDETPGAATKLRPLVGEASLQAAIAFAFLFYAAKRGGKQYSEWHLQDVDFVITGELKAGGKVAGIKHLDDKLPIIRTWAAGRQRPVHFFCPRDNEDDLNAIAEELGEREASSVSVELVRDMHDLFAVLVTLTEASQPSPALRASRRPSQPPPADRHSHITQHPPSVAPVTATRPGDAQDSRRPRPSIWVVGSALGLLIATLALLGTVVSARSKASIASANSRPRSATSVSLPPPPPSSVSAPTEASAAAPVALPARAVKPAPSRRVGPPPQPPPSQDLTFTRGGKSYIVPKSLN